MKNSILIRILSGMIALGLALPFLVHGRRTGSLDGEVTDSSGALVPRAKIVVSSGGWSRVAETDASGRYEITGLAPGTYEMFVRSAGFAPFYKAGLAVSAGSTTEMDAALDLGVLKQIVTVRASTSATPGSHDVAR